MKDKIVQKLDEIEEEYLSELSSQERREAVVMIDEIGELVDQIMEQEGFETNERKDTLSRTQFNKLLEVLMTNNSFAKQKNVLLMTSLQKNFTVNQVYRILHSIKDIDNKFTILELLVPNISNPKDMYRLFEYLKNIKKDSDLSS
ncbi:DUF4476 domain-containing protein [Halanaerobacter jeridensis]|uniref:DNA helicase IV n=1 Tax=Halanaerobacter jeridensis TaxID=706427 RepID=A0A939BRA9_9FIRM|nr:DUF4476 domain-containing protein [Halanaerobacter jeridensis]MBM7555801.1 DNA helicase IV [Halanaerobacter jeridensis]